MRPARSASIITFPALLSLLLCALSAPAWADDIQLAQVPYDSGPPPADGFPPPLVSNASATTAYAPAPTATTYLKLETLFLHLSHTGDRPLIYSGDAATGPVLVTSTDAASNRYSALPRVTFGTIFDDGTGWEFSYFGRNDYAQSRTVKPVGTVSAPAPLSETLDDWRSANAMSVSFATALHSAELNRLLTVEEVPSLTFLTGFRYVYFQDRFNMNANAAPVFAPGPETSNLSTRMTNNLFGAQTGVRWQQNIGRWSLSSQAKVGIYGNEVHAQQFLGDDGNRTIYRNYSHTIGQVAFLGELGLNANYQLTEACTLQAGYNFFWLDGVARAGNNLLFSNASRVPLRTHGDAFLHGPSAGVLFQF